ncbi:MAG: DUF2795 domain-containing protein [Ornithinibacter sp.]
MHSDESRADELRSDVRTLRGALQELAFPAQPDDVLVELVHHHAPPRILGRVRGLPQSRPYRSLDDLCAAVEG